MQIPFLFEKSGWKNLNDLNNAIQYITEMNGAYCGQYDDLMSKEPNSSLYINLVNIWHDLCISADIKPWSPMLPVETIVKSITSAGVVSKLVRTNLMSGCSRNLIGVEIGGGAGFLPVALSTALKRNILVSADVFLPFQTTQKLIAEIASSKGYLDQLDITDLSDTSDIKSVANMLSSSIPVNKQLHVNASIDFLYSSQLKIDFIVANDCLREFDLKSLYDFLGLLHNQLNDSGFLTCFGFGAPTNNLSLIWNLIERANLYPVFVGMKNIPQLDGSLKSLPHQVCIFRKYSKSGFALKSYNHSKIIFTLLETATADKIKFSDSSKFFNAYYLDINFRDKINAALNMEIDTSRNDCKLPDFPGLYLIEQYQ